MSIIAVDGFPRKMNLLQVVTTLAKFIKGQFEALNFASSNKIRNAKLCYIRLSELVDPLQVIEIIQSRRNIPKIGKLIAFIPDHIPDFPLATKPKKIPLKVRKRYNIPMEENLAQVLVEIHREILTEMESKYTGLYSLSQKTGHQLLDNIAQTIFLRLKHIMETLPEANVKKCFLLGKAYRRSHPHFADFQLILSTLHKLQDASGEPREQILENELADVNTQPYLINNIPFNKVKNVCNKYSQRIIKKMSEHIQNLKTEIVATDNDEEIARKKVREELKKLQPYLSPIVTQVIMKHFVPEKTPFHRIRIYGEPFIPPREFMTKSLKGYNVVNLSRSERMYNLITLNVPLEQYVNLMVMDGTIVGGAKLVIRSSEMQQYTVKDSLKAEMKAVFGVRHEVTADEPDPMDAEEWTEEW